MDNAVLALAVIVTLVAVGLFLWFLRDARASAGQPSPRRRAAVRGDPREALSLLGNALAATHDPRALLPVILEVTVEAAGATGGRVLERGRELAYVGEESAEPPDRIPLSVTGDDADTIVVLFPPMGGFSDETAQLARWLVSQAAIALENAELHHVVQRQAMTDELTGLANRRRFMEALGAEIERAERFGRALAILLADIDDFKRINDRFGHHVGDDALRRFSGLLTA
jgi:predicted signal transduction protein with EAL and GGDEF domain